MQQSWAMFWNFGFLELISDDICLPGLKTW